jgi:hypothetical protein
VVVLVCVRFLVREARKRSARSRIASFLFVCSLHFSKGMGTGAELAQGLTLRSSGLGFHFQHTSATIPHCAFAFFITRICTDLALKIGLPFIHVSLLRTATFRLLGLLFLAAFWSGLESRGSVQVHWMTASLLHTRQHLWKACTWSGAIDIGCAWLWLGLHLTKYTGLVLHGG